MILIGTDDGIYRWFEGCGWPIFHSLQGRSIVGLASPGAGVLAALDRDGTVLETVNNGQDWRVIPLPEGAGAPSSLAVWGLPGALVLAARPLGLISRPVGAPVPSPEELSPTPDRPGVAYILRRARTAAERGTAMLPARRARPRVDPRTAGWATLRAPSVKGDAAIVALTRGTGESAPWLASIRGAGLWRSDDGGAAWSRCVGLPDAVHAVRSSQKRPGTLVAATSGGVWVSGDDGRTWEERSAGLEDARHVSALDVKPDSPDVLMAGASAFDPDAATAARDGDPGFALYESNDGGKRWSAVRRGIPDSFGRDAITDVRFDPAAPENIVVALASGELWVSRNAGAYFGPLARQIHAARVLCAVG